MARGGGRRGSIADYTPAKLKKFIADNASASAGDITAVTAGTGLSGGGTTGAVTINLDLSDVIASDADNRLLTSDGDGTLTAEANLTYDGTTFIIGDDTKVNDDLPLYFGSNNDSYIKYTETADDYLVISGSSNGIVLSGSSVNIEGNLYVSEYIKHTGDADTHIRFTDDDINFKVGNVNFIDLTQDDDGQDEITFNEAGADLDFRVESDNNPHMLFVDSGNDKIGINTNAPDYTLDVSGAIGINDYIYHNGDADTYIGFPSANTINLIAGGHSFVKYDHSTGKILINNGNANRDTQIMADDGNVVLHVDAGNNRVGIGVTVPTAELDVAGNISASVNISASAFYGDAAYFGSNSDSFIKYTDSTDDYLTISGSTKGMVLSGSIIELNSDSKLEFGNGTAKIYSPTDHHLYITASSQVSFMGGTVKIWDDVDLAFGTNAEAHIKYNESIDDYLIISGSAKGMALSGAAVNIDGTLFLGTASFNGTDGKILLSDNTSALDITEGSNSYMKFSTTNSNERIIVGKEMRILDDTKLKFGNAGDALIEYNEDGDDYLIISGSHNGMVLSGSDVFLRSDDVEIGSDLGATFVSLKFKGAGTDGVINWYPGGDRFVLSDDLRVLDDKAISFGTAGESSIKYTEAIDDYLTISGSAKGVVLSGSNISTAGFLNMFVGGAVASDQKIYFGNQLQSYIEYNDNQDDFMTISGSANGIVLSGSTIQIDGTLEGASPLKIGGEVQFLSQGNGSGIKIGPNGEAKVYYENETDDALVLSGSSGGIILSGSTIKTIGPLQFQTDAESFLVSEGSARFADNTKLYFGTDQDANINYNSATSELRLESSEINLSGSSIYFGDINTNTNVDMRFRGSSNTGRMLWVPADDMFVYVDSVRLQDDKKLYFGTNQESHIEYNEDGDDYLTISGSNDGISLSGSLVTIDGKLGVGVYGTDVTDGITLPNTTDQAGQIKASSFLSYSSRRYKKDIKKLENPLEVINSLEGVSYEWKKSGAKDFGFIAEDVGQVLPGIVQWEDNGKDATGIDYSRIVSYLVEAVKEQQVQIEKLNQQLINRSEEEEKK